MKYTLLVPFLIFVNSVFCQKNVISEPTSYLKETVLFLASDSLQGRAVSSINEDKAANFIVKKVRENKRFKPKYHQFTYLRKDSTSLKSSKNIYCYINNHAKTTILIGAHYDHLGMGEGISRSYNTKGIHNGADDNASGVALLLDLAKKFNIWESKNYNYIFVFYSAHEIGLFGSTSFSKFAIKNFKPIIISLNFDMVGRLDNEIKILNVYGINTLTDSLTNRMEKSTFEGNLITTYSDKVYETDLKSFAESGIPCLSFTTGIHSDYHKITDDEEFINYDGMLLIENYIINLLRYKNH